VGAGSSGRGFSSRPWLWCPPWCFAGAAVAAATARELRRRIPHAALLGFAWTVALVLALLIPDYRVLARVAYAPILLVGALVGWTPVSLGEALPWPVVNQFVCIAGGLLWAATAVAYGRRSGGACGYCGRGAPPPGGRAQWRRRVGEVGSLRRGRHPRPLRRHALGVGARIPLGISEEFLHEGQEIGLWWAGTGLATITVGGALLTLGLVQRWGEVFIPLAVVPASLVSVLVTAAGLMFVRMRLAYYYRRRGKCEVCGRA
jgi:hypothetical protein